MVGTLRPELIVVGTLHRRWPHRTHITAGPSIEWFSGNKYREFKHCAGSTTVNREVYRW